MSNDLPSLEVIRSARILVVGDVILDRYWHGEVARISPEAPVPVVHIKGSESRLGGAANTALNVKSLGAQVTLMSMVGSDDAARELLSLLEKSGIAAEVGRDPKMQTIVKLRVIGRAQQMIRVDFETDPDHEILAGLIPRFEFLLQSHDAVVFSDYGKGGLAHVSQMIRLARTEGKPVLVDPKGVDWERYSGANLLTPNRAELAQVVGGWSDEYDLRQRVDALRRRLNVERLLLTRSEEGMTLFEQGKATSVQAAAREVADVTGAGDTVIAAYSVMMACGLDALRCMNVANKTAGLVVSKFGTATVTYDELRR